MKLDFHSFSQLFNKMVSYTRWPSFRDEEVVWDNVRVLKSSGETVSTGKQEIARYTSFYVL